MSGTLPSFASRARRKAALLAELRALPAGGGNPDFDQQRSPSPAQIHDRRQWLEGELEALTDVPILSYHQLRRL